MPPTAPNRRQVLCGLAVALAAPGALAACSSGGGGAAPPSPAAPPGTAPRAAAPAGVPLAEVPVGGGTVTTVGDQKILVVQPTAGTVKAYDATCPHQGATVAPPEGGVITCPAHQSQFDAATGAVRQGPAETGLTEVPARVVDGVVQVT
ncbi:Rieske (2Fe-2S) protein [Actinomycetospora cinnamomea]|uniref:Cytochrome bc1 complex Rieske iron-sulfur subunit n=1 Tax=Actinomycetospora cinnamomea TaxID=663609 RepID=A0A2U1FHY2_9PSEU|nr:Rieske (2Fe-2S) protein [Actinomycetospora cinnamomea]PVZ11785.1 nitrite reductase/ring-hydroxylating ferredoxin subunit [Actinomycetospora cinnamomea]